MVDDDDLTPRHKTLEPEALEVMSIEALNDYAAELEAVIARAGAVIGAKEAARDPADPVSVFRS